MSVEVEKYMIPCLNKKLFGIECLGCGFQRSLLAVFRGEFLEAFKLYPAIYTLLILSIFIVLNLRFKFNKSKQIIQSLVILNIVIILFSYVLKLTL